MTAMAAAKMRVKARAAQTLEAFMAYVVRKLCVGKYSVQNWEGAPFFFEAGGAARSIRRLKLLFLISFCLNFHDQLAAKVFNGRRKETHGLS